MSARRKLREDEEAVAAAHAGGGVVLTEDAVRVAGATGVWLLHVSEDTYPGKGLARSGSEGEEGKMVKMVKMWWYWGRSGMMCEDAFDADERSAEPGLGTGVGRHQWW